MAVKLHWEDRRTGKITHECVIEGFEELEGGRRKFYRRACKHNQKKGINPYCLGCIISSGDQRLPNLFESR